MIFKSSTIIKYALKIFPLSKDNSLITPLNNNNFYLMSTIVPKYDNSIGVKQINHLIIGNQKRLQELINIFQTYRFKFSFVNYCTIFRSLALIKKNINKNSQQIQRIQILKKCHIYLMKNIKRLNPGTFTSYILCLKNVELDDISLSQLQRKSLVQYYKLNFRRFKFQQISKSLRSLQQIIQKYSQEEWTKYWLNISQEIDFNKIQIGGLQIKPSDYVYLYFSLYFKSILNIQQPQKLKLFKGKIEAIIVKNILNKQYNLEEILLYLQKSNSVHNINIALQIVLSQLHQNPILLKSVNNLVIIMKMVKVVFNQEKGKKLLNLVENALKSLQKNIVVSQFEQYQIPQIKIQDKQWQFQEQDQLKQSENIKEQKNNKVKVEKMYNILNGVSIKQINKFMKCFTAIEQWDSEIFEILQQSFFYLINYDNIDKIDIPFYLIQRCKIGKALINTINKQAQTQTDEIITKYQESKSGRIIQIKKNHFKFIERFINHLNKHHQRYTIDQILKFITICNSVSIYQKKVKRMVIKLLKIKQKNINQCQEIIQNLFK